MRIILSGYTGHMGREVRASAERAGYPIVAGVDAMAKEPDDICVLSLISFMNPDHAVTFR